MCFVASELSAQVEQRGFVVEYQGESPKTPLSAVSIAARDAGNVMSENDGSFTLQFRTLHAGSDIQMRRIEKAGYEVMNQEVVEQFRVGGKESRPIQIVMCSKSKLQQLRDNYRSVASKRYEQQLKLSEAEAEKLRQEGKLKEEEYNARLDALEEEYEDKLTQLENYIDKFARIDLSEVDAYEQQIVSLVQEGQFDDAIALYDQQDFPGKIKQSREARQKLVDMKTTIAQAELTQAEENQRLRQSIDRQITLLKMAGGEENLKKVHELYHQVFLADTTYVPSRIEYATSLVQHNMTPDAITVLNAGIASTKDSICLGAMYNCLFYCQYEMNQFQEALVSVRRAESLFLPHWENESSVRSVYLPSVCFYYLLESDLLDANELSEKVDLCIRQWEPDTLMMASVDRYCALLKKLSEYYMMTANHEKSIWAAREGLKLGEILQRRWPWTTTYLDNCAFACSTFAIEGIRQEVVHAASTYIELLQPMLKSWSSTSKVLNVLENSFYVLEALEMHREYGLANSLVSLMDQWKVIQTIEKRYPIIRNEAVGRYNLTASFILLAQGKVNEAEKMAVESCDKIASSEIGAMYIHIVRPGAMGRICLAQGKVHEAEAYINEAIAQSKAIFDSDPNDFDADTVCRYYIDLLELYKNQGDSKAIKKTLKLAAKYATFEYDRQMIKNFKK